MKKETDWKLKEPKPKKLKGSLRLAIIVDPMGWSQQGPDEEIEQMVETLEDVSRIKMNLIASGQGAQVIAGKNLDLVVIDYGGMGYGSGDTAKAQISYVYNWAEDHPKSLLMVWTPYTADIYKEVEEEFGELSNVFLAAGIDSDIQAGRKIKEWFA